MPFRCGPCLEPILHTASLLRGVIEQPAHLLGVQPRHACRRGRRTKVPRERVSAATALVSEGHAAERHREASAHIVAKRHGANVVLAAHAQLFADCKRSRDDRRARMRLRRPVGVVGFIRMRKHAVDERRVDRSRYDVRSNDGGNGPASLALASAKAARPGGSSEPDTMAATVSRM